MRTVEQSVKWIDEQCAEAVILINSSDVSSVLIFNKFKKLIKPFYDQISAPLINKFKKAVRWVQCKYHNKGFENHFLAFDGLVPKPKLGSNLYLVMISLELTLIYT